MLQGQDFTGRGGTTVETIGNGVKTSFPARAAAITPDDDVTFEIPRAIYVGSAGTVIVTPASSETPDPVTFDVPDGGVVPVMVSQVREGGSASGLVGVW